MPEWSACGCPATWPHSRGGAGGEAEAAGASFGEAGLTGPQRGQALSRCTSWPSRDAWFFSLLIIAFSTSSRFMCPA